MNKEESEGFGARPPWSENGARSFSRILQEIGVTWRRSYVRRFDWFGLKFNRTSRRSQKQARSL